MSRETEAAELFAQSFSVNKVAKALKMPWHDAKKLKPATDAEESADGEVKLVWPIALEIPVEDIDRLVDGLKESDLREAVLKLEGDTKAQIIQWVLQKKLESAQGGLDVATLLDQSR